MKIMGLQNRPLSRATNLSFAPCEQFLQEGFTPNLAVNDLYHTASSKCLIAISQYSLEISMPMYCLFIFLQAKAVVPTPKNGSRTTSSMKLQPSIQRSGSSIGNCAGWPLLPTTPLNSQICPDNCIHRSLVILLCSFFCLSTFSYKPFFRKCRMYSISDGTWQFLGYG